MKVTHTAPSNIALVKYRGKKPGQIPCNPSISFSLSNSFTRTSVSITEKKGSESAIEFLFEGKSKPSFEPKIHTFFSTYVFLLYPSLAGYDFTIESSNSFPHSAGIASSASSMAALALCLCDLAGIDITTNQGLEKVSHLARLGSGSACRSLYNRATWGESPQGGSDLHATPVNAIHENFHNIQDTIILVDKTPKSTSSTQGHACMKSNAYADQRYKNAHKHFGEIVDILGNGDWEKFTHIVEQEALELHAMMMMSEEPFILLKPQTLALIDAIWKRRDETNTMCAFTIDAGPNIHLLYPPSSSESIQQFLKKYSDLYISHIHDYCST